MSLLSVNVNKLATLRNSRGGNNPNVTGMARKILEYGAHGITVHPRPDGRHIRVSDVYSLKAMIELWNRDHAKAEFNIEGYPSDDFLQLVLDVRPDQVTLVPDPPEALTSNAGWDLLRYEALLRPVLEKLKGIRVSLFVEPSLMAERQMAALARLKPERIELYTEAYADSFGSAKQAEVTNVYSEIAKQATASGIGVNAGHDLSQVNLSYLLHQVPQILEVSIGHALICEALEQGLATTVSHYLALVGGHET